jgi:elongation factor Tu
MGWFRKKPEVLDAAHLLQTTTKLGQPSGDPPPKDAMAAAGTDLGVDGGSAAADFRLTVSDVFSIKNRGTVVTGQVEAGSIAVGASVAITRDGQVLCRTTVTGVEMFRKVVDTAVAGQQVGLLLAQVDRSDVATGDLLTA